MRKSYQLFSFVVIVSMILAACQLTAANNISSVDTSSVTSDTSSGETSGGVADNSVDASDDRSDALVGPEFKNADTYVVLSTGDPESLDPAWTNETAGWAIENNIYEGMVWFEREKTDAFVPILSTGWTVSDAGDVYTFDVRDGVTFHAGGTLEPHDVAYSMQRALLQDRSYGPHWLTLETFFGVYSMGGLIGNASGEVADASTSDLTAACEQVKAAVVADDSAGTVTYTLAMATPWFLAMMANPFMGSVVDMEWMVEQGAWDGDCATWQDFYDPLAEDTVLYNVSNGTGPYMLDHWTPGEEIVLVANPNYWRSDGDAMWEGGPSGVANIDRIVIKNVTEWDTRFALFEAGDGDTIRVDAQFNSQMEPLLAEICNTAGECTPSDAGGWVTAYLNLPRPAMTALGFNWQINSDGGNVFQGSGVLDGGGIPGDFFTDIHIRKAFSYCFDYETMISELLAGEGIQAQGPIIADMLGYRDDGIVYSYDPGKCEEEFLASESGVMDTGFYMQLAYNTDNDTRRLAMEILKAGIEAINENFTIEVVSMPWPDLLKARRARKLPMYVVGWVEDFHDPHSWAQPFLHSQGAYGRVTNVTEPTASEFDTLIEQAASLSLADERRPIYEEIQLKAQEEAVMIWMYQPAVRAHFSSFIEDWYFNPAYSEMTYSYIYALDKVGP